MAASSVRRGLCAPNQFMERRRAASAVQASMDSVVSSIQALQIAHTTRLKVAQNNRKSPTKHSQILRRTGTNCPHSKSPTITRKSPTKHTQIIRKTGTNCPHKSSAKQTRTVHKTRANCPPTKLTSPTKNTGTNQSKACSILGVWAVQESRFRAHAKHCKCPAKHAQGAH